jgi:hypothetical protein
MSARSSYEEQLNHLLESCFQELQAMSDKDVLAGETTSAVRGRALARIERAAQEAGRRRLATAKAARETSVSGISARRDVSLSEARAYIGRVANDAQYTLAARKLEEMSEEEVFQLYGQIRELEARNEQ